MSVQGWVGEEDAITGSDCGGSHMPFNGVGRAVP